MISLIDELEILSNTVASDRSPRHPAMAAFAALFAYAAVLSMPAASVNQVLHEFGLKDSTQSTIFSLIMIGFLGGAIFGGRLSDRHGKVRVIALGAIFMSAAMFVFFKSQTFWMLLPAAVLAGIGGGFAEVVGTALVSDIYHGSERTAMMNWAQVAFCAGAVIQPLIYVRLLSMHMSWRTGYLAAGIVGIICTVIVLASDGGSHPVPHQEEHHSWFALVRNLFVLQLGFSLLLYVGAELGLANWVTAYLKRQWPSFASVAPASVSTFWIGIGVGRMLAARVSTRLSDTSMVRWSLGLGAAMIGLLLLAPWPWAVMALAFCVGVCLGPAWPTIISRAGGAFPGQAGAVIGIVAAFGCLGGAIVPKLIGVTSDAFGLHNALLICMASLLAGLVLMNVGGKRKPVS